jgi:tetratricopeptide (TPR) repeat protein
MLHELGVVAQRRGKPREAQERYRASLAITEALGDRFGVAMTRHQLGTLAQRGGRLDEAEARYQESLTTGEVLGDERGRAATYRQLSGLAEEQGQLHEALEWMVKSVALSQEFTPMAVGSLPPGLARLARRLGTDALVECWVRVTGRQPPDGVLLGTISAIVEAGGGGPGEQ